ncbi:iron transporter [Nguyenibacter vanlangensis]|uniref:Iron transporter n=1 Tax=Nguyenibacter vanlangensis TaxID=1216886 RepID=A0ABZ3D3U0_9PROT
MMVRNLAAFLLAVPLGGVLRAAPALAREYPIGGPVYAHDMEIAANYLVGVEVAPMMAGMPTGPGSIHLETDIHATADNVWGFPDGAWVPYLTITYRLTRAGSPWTATGTLHAMTAKDGPHYADNVRMDGPGTYTVEFRYGAPEANGFMHHVDKETGTPGFWAPFGESFTFAYPQK